LDAGTEAGLHACFGFSWSGVEGMTHWGHPPVLSLGGEWLWFPQVPVAREESSREEEVKMPTLAAGTSPLRDRTLYGHHPVGPFAVGYISPSQQLSL
jgi:hypothetical protein